MVISKLERETFTGELCIWCGYPISVEDANEAQIRWGVLLHDYCEEDHFENQKIEKLTPQGMYPLEDGFHISNMDFGGMGPRPPLSAKNQLKETKFNIDTNRYEYSDGSPAAAQSELLRRECGLQGRGLPWDKGKTTPDGTSVMSGWGEKSTWGDPRPLG